MSSRNTGIRVLAEFDCHAITGPSLKDSPPNANTRSVNQGVRLHQEIATTAASVQTPRGARQNEAKALRDLIHVLSEFLQNETIGGWLRQPNEAFDRLTPIEVIERGDVDGIWRIVSFLRSGLSS